MKSIIIIRHADASYDTNVPTDFDRPLTNQGLLDAKVMGKALADKKPNINLILSSSANRAITTARIIAEQIEYDKRIEEKKRIYNASSREILDIMSQINNEINSVIIFGHNPGLHMLTEQLSNQNFNQFPQCAIAKITLNFTSWEAINNLYLKEGNESIGSLEYFLTPKKIT